MKADDYEVVKVIGRGAFGEVQLVRSLFYFLHHLHLLHFFASKYRMLIWTIGDYRIWTSKGLCMIGHLGTRRASGLFKIGQCGSRKD